jgi:nitroreductase
MDFDQLILKRYSCRHYSDQAVEDHLLEKVLDAARLAPTAANRQPFQIIVIKTADHGKDLLKIYPREWFIQPPLILCICYQPDLAWQRTNFDDQNYAIVDATIVVDHITLQAADLGLGTCWIGNFNPQETRDFLSLPDDVQPVAFTPLGYPLDHPTPKRRKDLKELVRYDTW